MERLVDVKNLPTISPRLLANVPLLPLTAGFNCSSDSKLINMFDLYLQPK